VTFAKTSSSGRRLSHAAGAKCISDISLQGVERINFRDK
jgi:hypothetical protein